MLQGILILLAVSLACLLALAWGVLAWVLIHPSRRTLAWAVARGLPADPMEAVQVPYSVQPIPASDGKSIETWLVRGGNPQGPAVVFLHGWGDSRLGSLAWLGYIVPWASAVLLYDQRAHGESLHRTAGWGLGEAADALELARWLGGFTAKKVILAGNSMGAGIALQAAAVGGSGLVAGLMLDSPYRLPRPVVRANLARRGLPGALMAGPAWTLLELLGRVPKGLDMAQIARDLSIPLLVIHCTGDMLVPAFTAHEIAQSAPHGRLELFEGADHLGAAASDPKRYASLVEDFLGKVGR